MNWEFSASWGYVLAIFFFIIGFIAAVSTGSPAFAALAGLVLGVLVGRVTFHYRRKLKLVAFLIFVGSVIGMWFGSLFSYAGWMTASFVFGCVSSYVAHKNGWIESIEF